MKHRKCLVLCSIIIILITVFLGCDNKKSISAGFDVVLAKEESTGIYVAYSSESRDISIDDFHINLYYGTVYCSDSINPFETNFNLIVYRSDSPEIRNEYKIENFGSEEYAITINKKKYSRKASIEYNHYEDLVIPSWLFEDDEGEIVIMVKGAFDSTFDSAGWNSFYYKYIDSGVVRISKGSNYSV